MFTKLFQKQYESEPFKGMAIWAISTEETTVVIWNNYQNNVQITTFDKQTIWHSQIQVVNTKFLSSDKLHLNETGTILVHQGNERVSTWYRNFKRGKWIYQTCVCFQQKIAKKSSIFKNNYLFISEGEIFKIILRSPKFKMIRRKLDRYRDYLNCIYYSYMDNMSIYSSHDGNFSNQIQHLEWYVLSPIFHDLEIMPFYSSYQNNEIKSFAQGSLKIINNISEKSIKIKDYRIKECRTQSALNYFFQNQPKKIGFWHRESNENNVFNYEELEVKALDILLGQNGRVFMIQKRFQDGLIIELFEIK